MRRGLGRPSRAAPRVLALCLAALLAAGELCAQAAPAAARPAPAGAQRALLVRGADLVKGLPFFSPNAIAALSGAYGLGAAGSEVAVWYTRESLALGPEWKRIELGPYRAYELGSRDGAVVALRADRYSLFFRAEPVSPPLSGGEAKAFMQAFARKFLAFFENAATDAELSFPAFLDY